MNLDIMKYLGIAAFLIALFLILQNARGATSAINALSSANTNAILALQGRQPGPSGL